MQISRDIETTAPLEKVFPYLADFESTNEWDPGTVETRRLSGDGGVGTTYRNVSKFLGRKTELEYTVQTRDEGSRFVIEGVNNSARTTDDMTFTSTPSGTRVSYTATFRFQGVAGKVVTVLTPLMRVALQRLGDETAAEMKKNLDRL
jgi:hypothetical protein